MVVLTSDHGHMLGAPFEESTRIPLLVRYPRRIEAGAEDDAPVSNVDYAPTLLSFCGAKMPRAMQGIDHTERWTGKRRTPPQPVFAEGELGGEKEWRMIVLGPHKLVVDAKMAATHLYDLSVDPHSRRAASPVAGLAEAKPVAPTPLAGDQARVRRPTVAPGVWLLWETFRVAGRRPALLVQSTPEASTTGLRPAVGAQWPNSRRGRSGPGFLV